MRTMYGSILAAAIGVAGFAEPAQKQKNYGKPAKWMTAEECGVRVERKYRTARHERGMLNQHVCQPIDEAAWIWHPDVKEQQPGCFDIGAFFMSETGAGDEAHSAFVRFRRVFSSDGSPFIDWVGEWGSDPIPVGRGEGPGAIVNLYYLHAMKSVADMADAAGEPEIAAYWRKRAGELGGRIVEKFWVADKGLMADDIGHTKFSEHAQCFAILGDVLGGREANSAFGHLTDGTELARVTVYSLHYLFETFAKYGRGDLILSRFGLWRDYLKAGLSTCLETPVGYKYQRSDCHGWGRIQSTTSGRRLPEYALRPLASGASASPPARAGSGMFARQCHILRGGPSR